jgi:uncharacterized protein YndB with AHSA1/START domain
VTAYSFVTRWHAEARIETVFATIADADAWPEWWRGVRAATMIERTDDRHGNGGIGTRYRCEFRSWLPYSVGPHRPWRVA